VPVSASRVSVPLCIEDDEVYGMLTCLIGAEHAPLNQNDVRTIRLFAEMIAEHIEADVKALTKKGELIARLESVINGEGVTFLYQPIFDIEQAEIVGFEALARFLGKPTRGPDKWFSDAAEVAMDAALETAIVTKAFDAFARFPSSVSIGFNVSPKIVLSLQLGRIFNGMPLERVVLEVNEHLSFRQYDELARVLAPMRRKGLRISVDDAGGGLDTFRHIVSLRPDIIKLNRNLVRCVDTEAAHRALVAGLVQFAKDQRCKVIAVGVEKAAQLSKLKALGVVTMQGYLLGRPLPLAAAAALCHARSGRIPDPQAA
jgi:EAL domain-containing protein (putative c-di-GMP-specific phosphodiesterase class I)